MRTEPPHHGALTKQHEFTMGITQIDVLTVDPKRRFFAVGNAEGRIELIRLPRHLEAPHSCRVGSPTRSSGASSSTPP